MIGAATGVLCLERSPVPSDYPNAGVKIGFARRARKNLDEVVGMGVEEFEREAVAARFRPDGKVWRVHPRVNVYVDATTRCPYRCGFCIANTVDGRLRCGDIAPNDLRRNFDVLDRSGINYTVQLTGGEPLLHPEIDDVFDVLLEQGKKFVVNTNLVRQSAKLCQVDHVNLSCHHYNERLDSQIFGSKRDHEGIRRRIGRGLADKVRANCNLIGGYVDTYGEIMQYIAFAYWYLGVRNVSFSWLTALPRNSMYSEDIIEYVEMRPVPGMEDILNRLDSTSHWRFLKYRGGVACYYEIWEYMAYEKPVLVQFKHSDNRYLDAVDRIPDLVPDIIMHPNGIMSASWDMRLKVL